LNRKKQQGISTIALTSLIALVGFVGLCVFRMAPAYYDNLFVDRALKSLVEANQDLTALDRGDVDEHLWKFMSMNSVKTVPLEDFDIKITGERLVITVEYEVRVPIVANVEVVMTFEKQLDSDNPDLCCEYIAEDAEE